MNERSLKNEFGFWSSIISSPVSFLSLLLDHWVVASSLVLGCSLLVLGYLASRSRKKRQAYRRYELRDIPSSEILEEIVKIKDDKMVITEFGLLSVPSLPDEKIQLKLYSEAPSDSVISRDNFVAATTMLQIIFFRQIATEITQEYGSKRRMDDSALPFDFEELDEPIGKVDREINFYMNKGGIQIEFVFTKENKTDRSTITWKELK